MGNLGQNEQGRETNRLGVAAGTAGGLRLDCGGHRIRGLVAAGDLLGSWLVFDD